LTRTRAMANDVFIFFGISCIHGAGFIYSKYFNECLGGVKDLGDYLDPLQP
jgi:hypothetical protein